MFSKKAFMTSGKPFKVVAKTTSSKRVFGSEKALETSNFCMGIGSEASTAAP
jgi:hypothetical protein